RRASPPHSRPARRACKGEVSVSVPGNARQASCAHAAMRAAARVRRTAVACRLLRGRQGLRMSKEMRDVGGSMGAWGVVIGLCACAGDTSPRPNVTSAAVDEACSTGTSRPFDQPPVSGNPIAVAASGTSVFEAEDYNCGGEGQGYHDTTTTSNPGQTFRADEGVEIIDVSPSGLATNQFDIGEWLAYSVTVAAAGDDELGRPPSRSAAGGRA